MSKTIRRINTGVRLGGKPVIINLPECVNVDEYLLDMEINNGIKFKVTEIVPPNPDEKKSA